MSSLIDAFGHPTAITIGQHANSARILVEVPVSREWQFERKCQEHSVDTVVANQEDGLTPVAGQYHVHDAANTRCDVSQVLAVRNGGELRHPHPIGKRFGREATHLLEGSALPVTVIDINESRQRDNCNFVRFGDYFSRTHAARQRTCVCDRRLKAKRQIIAREFRLTYSVRCQLQVGATTETGWYDARDVAMPRQNDCCGTAGSLSVLISHGCGANPPDMNPSASSYRPRYHAASPLTQIEEESPLHPITLSRAMRTNAQSEKGNLFPCRAARTAPVEWERVIRSSWKNVGMQMRFGLARCNTIRLDQADPIRSERALYRIGNPYRHASDCGERFRLDLQYRRGALLRNDQTVTTIGRVDVHDGDGLVILVQRFAPSRVGGDLARTHAKSPAIPLSPAHQGVPYNAFCAITAGRCRCFPVLLRICRWREPEIRRAW